MPLHPDTFFDLSAFSHAALFADCRYVWEILGRIQSYLKQQKLGVIETEIPAGAILVDRETISLAPGVIVEPGAYIKGPCLIGPNTIIRQGAYIRGNLIVGKNCVIGHTTEVKNSLFLDGAKAAHFAYIGDSILGNEVNLGAGVKCANVRLDDQEITVHYQGERFDTGLRKFGAILGDGCHLGCNAVTNPGTLMGKKAVSLPCANFGGFIPANRTVRSEASRVVF